MNIRQLGQASALLALTAGAVAYGASFQAGDIFYGTQQSNTVAVYQPNGALVTTIGVPGGGDANSLAFDSNGRLYVSESTGTIQRFSNMGASLGTFATTAANEQYGALVFNKAGDLFAGTTAGNLSSGNGISSSTLRVDSSKTISRPPRSLACRSKRIRTRCCFPRRPVRFSRSTSPPES